MNAKNIALNFRLFLSAIRLIPHIVLMRHHPKREIIGLDIERWSIERKSCLVMSKNHGNAWESIFTFIQLMTYYPEYRSLFYHRLGWIGKLFHPICRPMSTLYIYTEDIGPGLFIQHGFATIIAAEKIGSNCWINQQVTIGFSNDTDCPTIGDNVFIYAGAKVLGKVTVGNNSIVGANSVVVENIPENCTAFGVPSRIFCPMNGVNLKKTLL